MAHKQVNALATLSGIAADDLIPIFDSSEAGDEKLKKYTVQELKSDLTSMDPSAFGNWVLVREINLNNEAADETVTWSANDDECLIIADINGATVFIRPNGDSGNNYVYGGYNQDGSVLTGAGGTLNGITVASNDADVFSYNRMHMF